MACQGDRVNSRQGSKQKDKPRCKKVVRVESRSVNDVAGLAWDDRRDVGQTGKRFGSSAANVSTKEIKDRQAVQAMMVQQYI